MVGFGRQGACLVAAIAIALLGSPARADVAVGEPIAPIEVPFPPAAPLIEAHVVLEIVLDAQGAVESATPVSRTPVDAPDVFAQAAARAVSAARFYPSTRDGQPVRSRLRYVVSFHPPAAPDAAPPDRTATPSADAATATAAEVVVKGAGWPSPRGLGDFRVERDLLEASPRQQTSEMLSAAPGFFVDHEDGEGVGNDVYLRGFDLDHGSGIEMRLGSIPINVPLHIQGQGYADANFILPEVVRAIRVLEGPFDPRQGDAAIVGSAYFDLGVPERGYRLGATYGSFGQMRLVGIAAPREADPDTFAAVSIRKTDGFGANRAGLSGSTNAQWALDVGPRDRLRILATAYGARSSLAGVVRQDDVDAGRIGLYDSYPYFAEGQGIQSSRIIVGATLEHDGGAGAYLEISPWFMWTGFRARQNFAGVLETAQIDPSRSARGDLFETTNREAAVGLTSRLRPAPLWLGDVAEIVAEPGLYVRAGHTDQTKSLLVPSDLSPWDRRIDAGVRALDVGAYLDLDARVLRRLRVSGGPRADLLAVSVDDRLAGAHRGAAGVAPGLHVTTEYELARWLVPAVSYGQGFRSLGAERLADGSSKPYSTVRSVEAGLRLLVPDERCTTRVSVFETRVANELVFEATSGGLELQNESVRRGFVGSVVARPFDWLVASTALSITRATFATRVPGVSHYVPSVPSALFRGDATARGRVGTLRNVPFTGRIGVGYTLLGGRHLTDTITAPTHHVVSASGALRSGAIEVGIDVYNVLGSKYPDDEQVYVSNWSLLPGQQPASTATHLTAAPPRTILGTVSLYF
jgi:iron complex outermembrane receptor protein